MLQYLQAENARNPNKANLWSKEVVVPLGFEPKLTVSKTAVLPLHHGTVAGVCLTSNRAVCEFIFTERSGLQRAETEASGADLQGGKAKASHELLVDQASEQGDVRAHGGQACDFAALGQG